MLLVACPDLCENDVVARRSSPDGSRDALLYLRDCGATTGFSTHISVLRSGDRPSGGGNTFRADDGHGIARAGEWGGPWTEMEWLAPDHLLVRYSAGSRIFEQDAEVSGVTVSYRPDAG